MTTATSTTVDIDRFTDRDCQMLALEIHARRGWPLFVLADDMDENENLSWFHCVVEHPDGRFIDINGAQSAQDLLNAWDGFFESSDDFEGGLFPITVAQLHQDAPADAGVHAAADHVLAALAA